VPRVSARFGTNGHRVLAVDISPCDHESVMKQRDISTGMVWVARARFPKRRLGAIVRVADHPDGVRSLAGNLGPGTASGMSS
jgi:hypothetical protein